MAGIIQEAIVHTTALVAAYFMVRPLLSRIAPVEHVANPGCSACKGCSNQLQSPALGQLIEGLGRPGGQSGQ